MEPILNLPPDQFMAALAELQLDPQQEAALVDAYNQQNAPQRGAGRRGMMYNLLDNIIGYDDDIVTPGERLGAGVQGFASGLLSDPVGTASGMVQGGYETIERAMAPGATPMDVMGAAGMAMGAGGIATGPRGALRSGLLRDAADETAAQQVARLLREGRADEVTDDLMAQADAQEMFRLYEAGETGADMPMDYESRMARAIQQGFDVNDEMYRGDAPRSAFQTGQGQRDQIGVTMSSRPDVAASYIPARGEGGIYPLVSRGSNDAVIGAEGRNWNVINRNATVDFQGDASTLRDYVPDSQFEEYDVLAGTDFLDTNDLSRMFQGYGADRVRFNDLVDRGGSARYYGPESSMPSDVMMVANPANVRSRFARLDPRLSHLANLNAANVDPLTGAAAVSASQQNDPLANLRAYIAAAGGVLGR